MVHKVEKYRHYKEVAVLVLFDIGRIFQSGENDYNLWNPAYQESEPNTG